MKDFYSFIRSYNESELRYEYRFTTNNSVEYYAYFIAANCYLPDIDTSQLPYINVNGYVFGFNIAFEDEDKKKRPDIRTKGSICKILDDFIKLIGNKCVIIYNCDKSDGKQQGRENLFTKWHDEYKDETKIHKNGVIIELSLPDGSSSLEYLGYLTLGGDNKEDLEIIDAEFNSFVTYLINFK